MSNTTPTPSTPPPAVSQENLDVRDRVKPTWFWVRDSRGYGSVTVTFVTIAFWVTTLAYVLSIFEKIGPLVVRQFDTAACSTYFIPLLTMYTARKFTEAHYGTGKTPGAVPPK